MSLLQLKSITIPIENLLLDPNNPRFCKQEADLTESSYFDLEQIQEYTFQLMIKEHAVRELEESIKEKGFTPVDNIFVKKLGQQNYYVVIEGNRRISAVKNLLKKHKEAKKRSDILESEILETLQRIRCMDMTENTTEEIDFVLGLRHHGSIKSWAPLPAAFNIYKKYMDFFCEENNCDNKPEEFVYNPKFAKRVADLYSLKLSDVREKLQTYRAYLQLYSLRPTSDDWKDKFSIIGDTVKNTTLRDFFNFDLRLCTLSDEGSLNFLNLVFGDDQKGLKPVIVGAAAGAGNLRDLAFVIANTSNKEEDIYKRIFDNREDPEIIKGMITTRMKARNWSDSLQDIKEILEKITVGELPKDQLGSADKETLKEIQNLLDKIKKASNIPL